MKDPAFLFYPNDYLGGTMGFSFEQHGAYLMLLIYQFNNGNISLEKACSIVGETLFESIRHKFVEKDGYICNTRLSFEIDKRKKYCDTRRENVQKRYNKPTYVGGVKNICSTGVVHMENENENRNDNAIKYEDENIKYTPISEHLKKRILEKRQKLITEDTIVKWNNTIRLMVERDKRNTEDIKTLIDECHDMPKNKSGFTWANNILSMDKLREQWNDGKIYIGMNATNSFTAQDAKKQMEEVDYGDIFKGKA